MNPSLKGNPSGRFLGVNLRQDRVSLADQDVAKAINADFHLQPGVIVLRLGRTAHNASALSNLAIRRISKINGHRYQVAGQRIYCDYSVITGITSLLATNITTLMPFRPLDDTTTWAFVANDGSGLKWKVNCQTWGLWGSSVPGVPTVAAGTTLLGLTGTFDIVYTFARIVNGLAAFESNPSNPNSTLTVTNEALTIGDMSDQPTSDPTLNGVGIYRSIVDTGVPLLVGYYLYPATSNYSITHTWEVDALGTQNNLTLHWSINLGGQSISGVTVNARGTQHFELDPVSFPSSEDAAGRRGTHLWEQTDAYVITQTKSWAKHLDVADASLGAVVEVDNGAPPTAAWAVQWQEHAWLCNDTTDPHLLWFSKRFRPEQFPADNYLEIGNPDDPLQCALPIGGVLGVFSRRTKYRVMGNAVSGFVALEAASPRGTPCPLATITSERGITFIARDGVFNTFLAGPDEGFGSKILPLWFGETVNDMAYLNWDVCHTWSAAMYKNRYYFSYAETGHTTPNRVAVYSWDTNNWYHYDHPLRSMFVEEDTDLFMGGGLDGFVYMVENGTTDGGSSIALDVDTKDFEGESRDIRKLFLSLKVDANTGGAAVTVKLYVDDVLEQTATVTTSTRQETLLRLPEGVMGHHWRVNFTYTGSMRIRLYACAALYLPLGVS